MARVEITDPVLQLTAAGLVAPVTGASVTINIRGGSAATLYTAESGGTAVAQPLTTRNGKIEPVATPGGDVWVDAGSYDIVVTPLTGGTVTEHRELSSGTASGGGAVLVDAAAFTSSGQIAVWDTTSGKLKSRPKVNTIRLEDYCTGDGTTDDKAGFQAAVAAASALVTASGLPVTVRAPAGKFRIVVTGSGSDVVTWPQSVSLVGDSKTATVFALECSAASPPNFIRGTRSTGDPYVGCTFRNFTVDMTNVAAAVSYNATHGKGFYMQYCRDCHWNDLKVIQAKATGIGVDFLVDCTVARCTVDSCGGAATVGSSGIGIGTGQSQDEYCVVANNLCINNLNHGIFFEKQGAGAPFWSRGALVTGNECRGNKIGISDRGVQGMVVSGNTMCDNTLNGFFAGLPEVGTGQNEGLEGLLIGNNVSRNGSVGVLFAGNALKGRWTVRANRISYNTAHGISCQPTSAQTGAGATPIDGLTIEGNDVHENGMMGITIGPDTSTGYIRNLSVKDNRVWNNGTGLNASYMIGIRIRIYSTRARVTGNVGWDDQASPTQTTGLSVPTGSGTAILTDALIEDNDMRGCPTPYAFVAAQFAGTSQILNNKGYNPQGPAAITVTASPFTYTAGLTPEVVYVAGGTVTSLVKNSINLQVTSGQVELAANEALVVTYSVAPTMAKDRR